MKSIEHVTYPYYRAWLDGTTDTLPSEEELTNLLIKHNIDPTSVYLHKEAYGSNVSTSYELTYVYITHGYVYDEIEFDLVCAEDGKKAWYELKRELPAKVPMSFDTIAKLVGFEYVSQYFGSRRFMYKDNKALVIVDENDFPAKFTITFFLNDGSKPVSEKVFTTKDYFIFLANLGIDEAATELAKERLYKIDTVLD